MSTASAYPQESRFYGFDMRWPHIVKRYNFICKQAEFAPPPLLLRQDDTPSAAYVWGEDENGKEMEYIQLTTGILELLNNREVAAVLAHEAKHKADSALINITLSGINALPFGAAAYSAVYLGNKNHEDAPEKKAPTFTRRLFLGSAAYATTSVFVAPTLKKEHHAIFERRADEGAKLYLEDSQTLVNALRKVRGWWKQHGGATLEALEQVDSRIQALEKSHSDRSR